MIYEQNDFFVLLLQREAEGQDFQLYPGELGKRIYNEISKEAWAAVALKQTMLINEKKLNMMNAEHRKLLEQEMGQLSCSRVRGAYRGLYAGR